MARREVVEITCGRCGKIETQSADELPKQEGNNKFEFRLTFQGKKISYDDLCRRCRSSLTSYVDKITNIPNRQVTDAVKAVKDRVPPKNPAGAG